MVKYSTPRVSTVFAALSDPTRRKMLERLSRSAVTVSELAAPFAMSLPAVSKHLRVLERAGLVHRQKDGRTHRLTLRAAPLREVETWLSHYRRFWETKLDALADYVETLHESTKK